MAPSGAEVQSAVAALSTFSLDDEQPSQGGLAEPISVDRPNLSSAIGLADVSAFKLALTEDTHGLNQLDDLVQQGQKLLHSLYAYRGCMKAIPQVPPNGHFYEATFQVLSGEVKQLMAVHDFQAMAARQLCIDMQRFSHSGRNINGPSVGHKWLMLRVLDVLLLLDCVKNSKPSLANDFTWYKRLFSLVANAQEGVDPEVDNDDLLQVYMTSRFSILMNLRAEMGRLSNYDDILTELLSFCLDALEAERLPLSRARSLMGFERHVMLRAVPTLLILATPTEKQGERLGGKLQPARCQQLFRRWPVIPALWDLHLAPADIVVELSPYFDRIAETKRFDVRPPTDERYLAETQSRYLLLNTLAAMTAAHTDFCCRFSATVNQVRLLGSNPPPASLCGNVLDLVLDGLAFLTDCALAVSEQCAWKYAHPAARPSQGESKPGSEYEAAVRWNYTAHEKTALLQVISYLKGVGRALESSFTLLCPLLFAGVYSDVRNLVQDTLHLPTHNKRVDMSLMLDELRSVLGDFTPDDGAGAAKGGNKPGEELRVAQPSSAQIHAIQYLLEELVLGSIHTGGLPGSAPPKDLLRWRRRFLRIPHALNLRAHLTQLTDVSQLWFRETFLERAGCVQFPIDCSLPWILVSHALTSLDKPWLVDDVLLPFDIYNDAGNAALYTLRQRHLYDEIEAEIDLCFDQALCKLGEHVYCHYKREAARQILDPELLVAAEKTLSIEERQGEGSGLLPCYSGLFNQTHLQLLGRSVDVALLLRQRISRLFRDNLEFLMERFKATGLLRFLEHSALMTILDRAHALLSKQLALDDLALMLMEAGETVSMTSFSSRLGAQVWSDICQELLPSSLLNFSTQRFVPSKNLPYIGRGNVPHNPPYFLAGSPAENAAVAQLAGLSAHFVGSVHIDALVGVLGKQGLPWLVHQASLHLRHLVTAVLPGHVQPLLTVLPIPFVPPHVSGNPQDALAAIEAWLTSLLAHPSLDGALQGLRQIGNLLAFLSLLDEAMQSKETRQVICAAPFLGIVPGPEGQLQQLVGRDESAGAPLTGLIERALASISDQMPPEVANAAQQSAQGARRAESVYWSCISAGSVVGHVLTHLRLALEPFHNDWAPQLESGRPTLAHLYSALHFALCTRLRDGSNATRWSRLGDSVTLGGLSLVHCLGLTPRWKLMDLTRGIQRGRASGFAPITRRPSGGQKGGQDNTAMLGVAVHLAGISCQCEAFLATHHQYDTCTGTNKHRSSVMEPRPQTAFSQGGPRGSASQSGR